MISRCLFLLLIVMSIGLVSACDSPTGSTEILVDPAEIPSTERGVLAMDNRFFFIGGGTLYELLTQPDGTPHYEVVTQRDDCDFSGLAADDDKLYAACAATGFSIELSGQTLAMPSWSELVRVDLLRPASDPKRVTSVHLSDGNMLPNGMAVDDRGDIYITNTFAVIFRLTNMFSAETIPAVTRVRVTDESSFQIEKHAVLSSIQGGMAPNGIQIRGDRLWFVSANTLYEARIGNYGLRNMKKIYQAGAKRMFDDFAVLPDNTLAIAEFPTPLSLMAILFPDSWPSPNAPSQLTFVSTQTGEAIHNYPLDSKIVPSSVLYIVDDQGPALYLTDFFFGGLYRVCLEE